MSEKEKSCGEFPVGFCKFAIGFISLSTYIVLHMMDIISRHVAVAFNVPTHNTGIYFGKVYCLRTLMFVIGGLIENGIFQAVGGDRYPETSTMVRRYVGVGSLGLVLFARCVYLFLLYSSSNLSYHIYIILVIEAFPTAFHDNIFMALGSEFITVITPMYNLCRIFISCCQLVLDRFWYAKPLLMIKMQAWILVTFTAVSTGLWYYYNFHIKGQHLQEHIDNQKPELTQPKPEEKGNECKGYCEKCKKNIGNDGIGAALSPVIMYWATTMFRDFLFPATLPYGLLHRDKCHIINVMIPFFVNLGPVTFFVLDNFTPYFACWSWHYHLFWILFIPMPIIFTYALKAMFTLNRSARRIINSRARVTSMSFALMLSFGFNEPLTYIGVAKYAFRLNPGGFTLMGYHLTTAFFCRVIFSKIAIGFSDTRISLGYHLPKFRPNHKMSRKNLYIYLIRQTFKRALRDFKGDYKLDIKKYL